MSPAEELVESGVNQPAANLKERVERFGRTMTSYDIDAMVDQRISHPGSTPDKGEVHLHGQITEINCGNRPVYNLSDLHLDTDPNWISGDVLPKINDILLEAISRNGIVIFNGDTFEGWHNVHDGTGKLLSVFEKKASGKYKSQSNNAKHFRKFIQLMRDPRIDTVALQGNHDPQSWYDSVPGQNGKGSELQNMLGCYMATHVILNQNGKRTFVSHGHQLFVDSDEVKMGTSDRTSNEQKEEKLPGFREYFKRSKLRETTGKILTRAEWLMASTNRFTRNILNGENDKQFLEVLPSWIAALEGAMGDDGKKIDTVSLGHSHLGGNYPLSLPDGRTVQVGVTGSGKGGLHGELGYATIENGRWEAHTREKSELYKEKLGELRERKRTKINKIIDSSVK